MPKELHIWDKRKYKGLKEAMSCNDYSTVPVPDNYNKDDVLVLDSIISIVVKSFCSYKKCNLMKCISTCGNSHIGYELKTIS